MLKRILMLGLIFMISIVSYGKTSVTVKIQSTEVSATEKNLYDKKWILSEFGGRSIVSYGFDEIPFIMVDEKEKKLTGFGGVNRFFGITIIDKDIITFNSIGSTKMAGPFMNFESEFFNALSKVNTYVISGNTLSLLDKELNCLMKLSNIEESKEKKTKVDVSGEISYETKIF